MTTTNYKLYEHYLKNIHKFNKIGTYIIEGLVKLIDHIILENFRLDSNKICKVQTFILLTNMIDVFVNIVWALNWRLARNWQIAMQNQCEYQDFLFF